MNAKQLLVLGALALTSSPGGYSLAQETQDAMQDRYVRVADIEIDPARLEAYKTAVKEEIEASVRVEPGVVALYAVSQKDNPARVLVLEIYADVNAYKAHLETPHFKKYKAVTQDMVGSLKLFDTIPIALGAKAK